MGNRVTRAVACLVPVPQDLDRHRLHHHHHRDRVAAMNFPSADPLDEGLGHSFCYIRPHYLVQDPFSPSQSDRFTGSVVTDPDPRSASFRSTTSASADNKEKDRDRELSGAGAFKSISGASVSANTSTPCTIVFHQHSHPFANVPDDRHAAFESSASFASLPLQPVPKGVTFSGPILGAMSGPFESEQQQQRCFMSGPIEQSLTFGPLERVFMSGPLERGFMSGPIDNVSVDGNNHYSAPLAGFYHVRTSRKQRKVSHFFDSVRNPMRQALHSTRRSIIAPVRRLVWRYRHNGAKDEIGAFDSSDFRYVSSDDDPLASHNLQWAQGKAGEDRVHVVVSEDQGWLFVGIYDGFNGPDAPDFLMKKLYRAVYKELRGFLWDVREAPDESSSSQEECKDGDLLRKVETTRQLECGSSRFCEVGGDADNGVLTRSRTLREFLDDAEREANGKTSIRLNRLQQPARVADGLAMDVQKKDAGPDCDRSNSESVASKRWTAAKTFMKPIFRKRPRKGSAKKCISKRNYPPGEAPEPAKDSSNRWEPKLWTCGAADHGAVLRALGRALEATEQAYLALSDLALEENPELALMGSCILVALMKDKDVYVLNVGDSRAIVAQEAPLLSCAVNPEPIKKGGGGRNSSNRQDLERISEESPVVMTGVSRLAADVDLSFSDSSLIAVQLSTDHSTSIEEEVRRIRAEHPDDEMCILNDRVKGRLKVTRAFGAGFLKKPRWNSAILKMFQIDYVGSAAYISCKPALHHHRLGPHDRFLILSSDGLYQYFSNQEVVSYVEWFMDKFPEGDPAQFLIEELLFRAAKKAGLDFHELLDIPQGDRRKYHDDVSVMVISIDGKIWRSSG